MDSYRYSNKGRLENVANTQNLHVSRVPREMDDVTFKELFSKCGEIQQIKLIHRVGDYKLGKVRFFAAEAVDKAFELFNRTQPYFMSVSYERNNYDERVQPYSMGVSYERNNYNDERVQPYSMGVDNEGSYKNRKSVKPGSYSSVNKVDNISIDDVKILPRSIISKKIIQSGGNFSKDVSLPVYRGRISSWDEKDFVSLIFSHCDFPGHFWAADNTNGNLYKAMEITYNSCRNRIPKLASCLTVGSVVAAKQMDGDYWFRAVILEKIRNGWLVQDLDFGDTSVVNYVGVLPIECCQYPALAVAFKVLNSDDNEWSKTLTPKSRLTLNVDSVEISKIIVNVLNGHFCEAMSIWEDDSNFERYMSTSELLKLPNRREVTLQINKLPVYEFTLGEKLCVQPTYFCFVEGRLYVQIRSEENSKIIKFLSRSMNEICERRYLAGTDRPMTLAVSRLVCTKWDATGEWHRSEILEVGLADTVRVQFVDYGYKYYVKRENLIEIPKDFRSFAPLAVPVILNDIEKNNLETAYTILQTLEMWKMLIVNDGSLPLKVLMFDLSDKPLSEYVQKILDDEEEKMLNRVQSIEEKLSNVVNEVKVDLDETLVNHGTESATEEISKEMSKNVSEEESEEFNSPVETAIFVPALKEEADKTTNDVIQTKLVFRELSKRSLLMLKYDLNCFFYENAPISLLPVGKTVTVIFTEVSSPCYLYCWNSDVSEELEKLSEIMKETMEKEAKFSESCSYVPQVDEICVIKCEDNFWYRAACLDRMEKDCRFVLVDYGRESTVPYTSIRPMRINFMQMPLQGIFCQIDGISDKHFDDKEHQKFKDLILVGESINIFVVRAMFNHCSYFITIPCIENF